MKVRNISERFSLWYLTTTYKITFKERIFKKSNTGQQLNFNMAEGNLDDDKLYFKWKNSDSAPWEVNPDTSIASMR